MKRQILLVAALCLATSAAAQKGSPFTTTSQLIEMCEATEGKGSNKLLAMINSTGCVGYLMGIMGAQHLAKLRGSEDCDNFSYTGQDLVRVYLGRISELRRSGKGQKMLRDLEKLPSAVAYKALEDAYPCKME